MLIRVYVRDRAPSLCMHFAFKGATDPPPAGCEWLASLRPEQLALKVAKPLHARKREPENPWEPKGPWITAEGWAYCREANGKRSWMLVARCHLYVGGEESIDWVTGPRSTGRIVFRRYTPGGMMEREASSSPKTNRLTSQYLTKYRNPHVDAQG